MRRTAAVVIILLVAAAHTMSAQFGGGGGGRGRGRSAGESSSSAGNGAPPQLPPTVAALVLEHDKDLALTDAQRTTIQSVRQSQDSANRPWLARLDSLRPLARSQESQPSTEELEGRRKVVASILDGMHDTNAEARIKVMAALGPEQQKKAAEYEEDARKRAESETRRKNGDSFMGGGRGGGRRGPED